ncbi:hypothetical protein [Paenibacillus dendritiformis]|uniref:hypothetical protein n=1 Tax=Paenibacillus dendritiformis TaxID=130049 RepID=UPI000314F321|nr:hypothetical protein [Paenibacillus dendritiformis]CAH8773237.1 hypothetical protein H7S4_006011 [Paenibacillus dendritiformis]
MNGRASAIPNRTERTTGQASADKTAEAWQGCKSFRFAAGALRPEAPSLSVHRHG